jgi:hypothetical protein
MTVSVSGIVEGEVDAACFRKLLVHVGAVQNILRVEQGKSRRFLSVNIAKVSKTPEQLDNPKEQMINLARMSPNSKTRKAMVPRPGARSGPAYTSYMIEYIQEYWRPAEAIRNADSLRRAVGCLRRLLEIAE